MSDAISMALGNMQMTMAKATDAAHNLAHANLPTSISAGDPSVIPAEIPAVINDTGKTPAPDVLQDVLDFQEAARAHEAQIKVVEALNDMQQRLVEALGWVAPQNPDAITLAKSQSNH